MYILKECKDEYFLKAQETFLNIFVTAYNF